MKMNYIYTRSLAISLAVLLFVVSACQPVSVEPAQADPDAPLTVVATYSILGDLVANVGGDHVNLITLVGPDGDAHTFEPTPADGVALTQASLIFENGLEFETWLDDLYTAAGTEAERVVVTDGITRLTMGEEGHDEHGDDHSDDEHADEHDDHADDEHADEHDHEGEGDDHADEHDHEGEGDDHADEHDHEGEGDDHADEHDHEGEGDDHADEHDHEGEGDEHADEHDHEGEGDKHDDEHDHDDEGDKHDDEHGEHSDDEHADEHDDHEGDDHAGHADEHGHHHGEFDPHVWHDVANAISMVEVIRDALSAADPDNAADYAANADAYLAELAELDGWVTEQIEGIPAERRKLVTAHDTFGYFAKRYGLEVVGTAIASFSTEAADPSAGEMVELIEQIRAEGVPAIFAENVSNPALIERIAQEAGVKVGAPLYTDALGPADSDGATYIEMVRYNVGAIVTGLSE